MDKIALVGCGENRRIGDFIRVMGWEWSIGQRKLLSDFCIRMSLWNYWSKPDAYIALLRK